MVEAVNAAIDYCFKIRALDALTCGHFISNTQSKRVIEKCGFKYVKSGKYYAKQLRLIIDDSKYIMLNPARERKNAND
jgi:ribosomal-protein-alanine N-acetyltransferase